MKIFIGDSKIAIRFVSPFLLLLSLSTGSFGFYVIDCLVVMDGFLNDLFEFLSG